MPLTARGKLPREPETGLLRFLKKPIKIGRYIEIQLLPGKPRLYESLAFIGGKIGHDDPMGDLEKCYQLKITEHKDTCGIYYDRWRGDKTRPIEFLFRWYPFWLLSIGVFILGRWYSLEWAYNKEIKKRFRVIGRSAKFLKKDNMDWKILPLFGSGE